MARTSMSAPIADLIRHLGIAEQTFYRWKRRYAGLESEQVREFRQLQDENAKLKRLVADLSLDKVMLQDVLAKNGKALATAHRRTLFRHGISDQRAARLSDRPLCEGHVSVSKSSRSSYGPPAADLRPRPNSCALWLSQDSGALESRGLGRGQEAGL